MTDIERSWTDKPRTRSFPTTTERTTTMKHFTKARTLTVAVATGSAVVLAGGVAYAIWTSTGTGAGTAKAGTITFTVSATAPTFGSGSTVHPGSIAGGTGDTAGGDLYVTINNTSGFTLKAASVVQAGVVTVSGSPIGTCVTDTGTFPNQSSNSAAFIGTQAPAAYSAATTGTFVTYNLPAGTTIPTGSSTVQLLNVVGMGTASLTGCQNATLSIPVTVAATS